MAEKYQEKVQPNIVPTTFTPKPEDFQPQVSQELRSKQARWAQSYALKKIENVENQLHKAHYKRDMYRLEDGYSEQQAVALLENDLKAAKTARTRMMDDISEWAGAYDKDHFIGSVLPRVWDSYVKEVTGEPAPKEEKADEPNTEEALAPEEEELQSAGPVLPSARYDDLASKPKSKVAPPEQVSMGEVLQKIEKDNSND